MPTDDPLAVICTPGDVFDLSDTDPMIRDAIGNWKLGLWSWDEMLCTLVVVLHDQRDRLAQRLNEINRRKSDA